MLGVKQPVPEACHGNVASQDLTPEPPLFNAKGGSE